MGGEQSSPAGRSCGLWVQGGEQPGPTPRRPHSAWRVPLGRKRASASPACVPESPARLGAFAPRRLGASVRVSARPGSGGRGGAGGGDGLGFRCGFPASCPRPGGGSCTPAPRHGARVRSEPGTSQRAAPSGRSGPWSGCCSRSAAAWRPPRVGSAWGGGRPDAAWPVGRRGSPLPAGPFVWPRPGPLWGTHPSRRFPEVRGSLGRRDGARGAPTPPARCARRGRAGPHLPGSRARPALRPPAGAPGRGPGVVGPDLGTLPAQPWPPRPGRCSGRGPFPVATNFLLGPLRLGPGCPPPPSRSPPAGTCQVPPGAPPGSGQGVVVGRHLAKPCALAASSPSARATRGTGRCSVWGSSRAGPWLYPTFLARARGARLRCPCLGSKLHVLFESK